MFVVVWLNGAEQLEKRLGRLLRNTNGELDPSVSDVEQLTYNSSL